MSENNITGLPNIEQDKLIAQLEYLKRNMEMLIEQQKIIARIRRASFLAYVEQGFTVEQSLQLCK